MRWRTPTARTWREPWCGRGPAAASTSRPPEQLAVPLQCRHCEDAPCVEVCPTAALSRLDAAGARAGRPGQVHWLRVLRAGLPLRRDSPGVGRKGIIKCDLCAGRLARGLEPACVASCPVRALAFEEIKEDAARRRLQTALRLANGELDEPSKLDELHTASGPNTPAAPAWSARSSIATRATRKCSSP